MALGLRQNYEITPSLTPHPQVNIRTSIIDGRLQHEIIEFLTQVPQFISEAGRVTMMRAVKIDLKLPNLDFSGSPKEFITRLIRLIAESSDRISCLIDLLEGLKISGGPTVKTILQGFCDRLSASVDPPPPPPKGPIGKLFICYVSEDRNIVKRLGEELKKEWISVSYRLVDDEELGLAIGRGLKTSPFGLLFFSRDFFQKKTSQEELIQIVTKGMTSEQLLLPLWYNVTKKRACKFSPDLRNLEETLVIPGENEIEKVICPILGKMFEVKRQFRFTSLLRNRKHAKEQWQHLEFLGKGTKLEMVEVSDGTFTMGAPESEEGSSDKERPQHTVSVRPFYMSRYPVTQEQWRIIVESVPAVKRSLRSQPCHFRPGGTADGRLRPVEQITWDEAVEFCDRLSELTGRDYRLPTEAEWEYACRAGTTTAFHFGDTITPCLANYKGEGTKAYRASFYPTKPRLDKLQGRVPELILNKLRKLLQGKKFCSEKTFWKAVLQSTNDGKEKKQLSKYKKCILDETRGIYSGRTIKVTSCLSNAFGICGMHGNVREWCQDRWHDDYRGALDNGGSWEDPPTTEGRVLRGGSCFDPPDRLRSACRKNGSQGKSSSEWGFRLVCSPLPEKKPVWHFEERRIDVAVPRHMLVENSVKLRIQVRFPDSPQLDIKNCRTHSRIFMACFPRNHQTGQLDSATLWIQIDASLGIIVSSEKREKVDIPAQKTILPFKEIHFKLTPKKSARGDIKLRMRNTIPTTSRDDLLPDEITVPLPVVVKESMRSPGNSGPDNGSIKKKPTRRTANSSEKYKEKDPRQKEKEPKQKKEESREEKPKEEKPKQEPDEELKAEEPKEGKSKPDEEPEPESKEEPKSKEPEDPEEPAPESEEDPEQKEEEPESAPEESKEEPEPQEPEEPEPESKEEPEPQEPEDPEEELKPEPEEPEGEPEQKEEEPEPEPEEPEEAFEEESAQEQPTEPLPSLPLEFVKEIERLVQKDRLEEAIQKLLHVPAYHQEAILLFRRLNDLQNLQRQQLLGDEDVMIEKNKLAGAILDVLPVENGSMPDIARKRRIDTVIPNQVIIGQPVELFIQVRFPDSELLGLEQWHNHHKPISIEQFSETIPMEFPIDPRTGRIGATSLEFRVVVDSEQCMVSGDTCKVVKVPPNEFSHRISFLLTPKKSGECLINVEVYTTDAECLGVVPITTTVMNKFIEAVRTLVASFVLPILVSAPKTSSTSQPGVKSEQMEEESDQKENDIKEVTNTSIHTGKDYFENIKGNVYINNNYILNTQKMPQTLSAPLSIFHNLPQPDYGHFIGREEELEKVTKILRPYPHSQNAVVTIDGIGGIGKSALALELAHHFLRQFDELPAEERFEAIIWTSAKQNVLTAEGIRTRQQVLHTLQDIYTAIAMALHREDITRAATEEQDAVVTRALTQQRTLLLVDNLETVDDEAVLDFLRELPAPTKAIVTTRHRIDVAYPVRLNGMPWEDGRALIVQECEEKEVTLAEEMIRQLYERTGGVPLALVWSVAQMGYGYAPQSVLKRLGQPTNDITKFCFEGAVQRIKQTPAYSLLLTLSLCADSASRETLGYATELPDLDRDDGLVKLEKLSLVNKQGDRFWLLPLTKVYASAEFEAYPKRERLREKWIEYFSTACQKYSSGYWNWNNYGWLLAEGENLLTISRWAFTSSSSFTSKAVVLPFARAIKRYLDIQGRRDEILEYGQKFLQLAQNIHDKAIEAWIRVHWLGWLHIGRTPDLAEPHIREALLLYKQLEDPRGTCFAMRSQGQIVRIRGNLSDDDTYTQGMHQKDEEICRKAMELAKAHQFGDGVAYIHMELGRLKRDQEDWAGSKPHWEAIVDWCENHQDEAELDESFLMSALGDFGWIEHQLGQHEHGRSLLERSLAFTESMGGKGTTMLSRLRLAEIEKALGNHEKALEHVKEALYWTERLNMPRFFQKAQELFQQFTEQNASESHES